MTPKLKVGDDILLISKSKEVCWIGEFQEQTKTEITINIKYTNQTNEYLFKKLFSYKQINWTSWKNYTDKTPDKGTFSKKDYRITKMPTGTLQALAL